MMLWYQAGYHFRSDSYSSVTQGQTSDIDSDGDGVGDLSILAWTVATTGTAAEASTLKRCVSTAKRL